MTHISKLRKLRERQRERERERGGGGVGYVSQFQSKEKTNKF